MLSEVSLSFIVIGMFSGSWSAFSSCNKKNKDKSTVLLVLLHRKLSRKNIPRLGKRKMILLSRNLRSGVKTTSNHHNTTLGEETADLKCIGISLGLKKKVNIFTPASS